MCSIHNLNTEVSSYVSRESKVIKIGLSGFATTIMTAAEGEGRRLNIVIRGTQPILKFEG